MSPPIVVYFLFLFAVWSYILVWLWGSRLGRKTRNFVKQEKEEGVGPRSEPTPACGFGVFKQGPVSRAPSLFVFGKMKLPGFFFFFKQLIKMLAKASWTSKHPFPNNILMI